jgi:hypothetical protein
VILNNRSMSVRGRAPTVGGYEKCGFYARLRLIESIINECMVAPNIHKRVLWNEDIRVSTSAYEEGKEQGERQTSVSPGFEPG